jgi:class 3 adenylate cyclase
LGESDEIQEGLHASVNLDQLLEQRERIEALIKNKYTRVITIMFTDLKGSTKLAETQGDVATRLLIKRHNDIVFPAIAAQRGTLVKTMGDGTLSYFAEAADAVRAAVQAQRGLKEYNRARPGGIPLLMRVGINTGSGIVESNDLFGDAVNVASRFETLAEPGEILISESTCAALGANCEEFFVRLKMTTGLKEKTGLFKAFKVCLSPEEFAEAAAPPAEQAVVGHSRRGTDHLPAPPLPTPVPAPDRGAFSPADRAALERVKKFEQDGELLEMYLLCGEAPGPGPLAEVGRTLQARLAREQPLGTNFSGKSALWFHKTSIVLGRTPDADFPLTNQAISRVPLKFGIARDGGVLSISSRGAAFKPVEIEQRGERTQVTPDTEFPLGHQGRVILAGCFPIEYHVYEARFLILQIVDPAQELRRVYAGPLRDIWRGFDQESKHLLIIGR